MSKHTQRIHEQAGEPEISLLILLYLIPVWKQATAGTFHETQCMALVHLSPCMSGVVAEC